MLHSDNYLCIGCGLTGNIHMNTGKKKCCSGLPRQLNKTPKQQITQQLFSEHHSEGRAKHSRRQKGCLPPVKQKNRQQQTDNQSNTRRKWSHFTNRPRRREFTGHRWQHQMLSFPCAWLLHVKRKQPFRCLLWKNVKEQMLSWENKKCEACCAKKPPLQNVRKRGQTGVVH